MKIEFNAEVSHREGEPIWFVHEDDRDVSHAIPLSDIAKPTEDPHVANARRALSAEIGDSLKWINGALGDARRQIIADLDVVRQLSVPRGEISQLAWLLNVAIHELDLAKPGDRSPMDREYAILRTDLDKAFAWAHMHDL